MQHTIKLVLTLLHLIPLQMTAQQILSGEYLFRRREMIAVFSFTSEGDFEFFYSYGSIDRTAKGSYTIEGDVVKLKSNKVPGKDFAVNKQHKSGKGYVIKCKSPNPHLLSHMQSIVFVGDQDFYYEANDQGEIVIDLPSCNKIFVANALFPDTPSLIKDENTANNQFEVTILPSAQEVSFNGIDLQIIDPNTLACLPNYFMPLEDIQFIKE